MGRTKTEETPQLAIDITQEQGIRKTVDMTVEQNNNVVAEQSPKAKSQRELVNCLRNEKVQIKFVEKPSAMIHDPRHPLNGGMAETAFRNFVVPRILSTGAFKNVLTDSEKDFLEHAMGLEENALSIYKRENNFWDDSNEHGIGRVTLHKTGNTLDLSIPEDYIKYKILLANKNRIAASLQELEDHPKATYEFVIIEEAAETKANLRKMDNTKRCYMEYGKIAEDIDTLRVVIELLEGRPTTNNIKLDYLQGKINEYIQRNPKLFLTTVTDELLPIKVLIKRCLENGIIGKKNDAYYLVDGGTPLCEIGEDSTLNNAAKYIASVKRQELKYSLEAKLKR